jgi:hypothetical protein
VKKRDLLYKWAQEKGWFYLCEVPYESFGMSRATASTALIDLCKRGKADFRIQGLKQYRVKT